MLDHVAIAVVRAAVLKGEIDGLKGYAIPCLLWLRVCEIEAHLNLEAKLREDGEAPSSQPLLAEDVAYSTAWVNAPLRPLLPTPFRVPGSTMTLSRPVVGSSARLVARETVT